MGHISKADGRHTDSLTVQLVLLWGFFPKIRRRSPSEREFTEVIRMEFEKALIDEIKKAGTSYNSESIGNYNWNCDGKGTIKYRWGVASYLRKEKIEWIARQLNIDTRRFTEEDYQKIATLFFSRYRLVAVTDCSLETAIRLHMTEKEASRKQWRRY